MLRRHVIVSLSAFGALFATAGPASAKKHHHKSGHSLLGGELKQNGRHEVDKAGRATVVAEVVNSKVTTMSATHPQKGALPVQKLRSTRKMAEMDPGFLRVATGNLQLAQEPIYYFAWCFDDGLDEYCYWFPSDAIAIFDDGSWIEYVG